MEAMPLFPLALRLPGLTRSPAELTKMPGLSKPAQGREFIHPKQPYSGHGGDEPADGMTRIR